jgi:hypothetical protein
MNFLFFGFPSKLSSIYFSPSGPEVELCTCILQLVKNPVSSLRQALPFAHKEHFAPKEHFSGVISHSNPLQKVTSKTRNEILKRNIETK